MQATDPTASIPTDHALDDTFALLSEGYTFIAARCARLRSDVFATRLMLRKVICAMGEDAAAMFYHPGRFTRKGALPPTTLLLLQDLGSVQLLDGEAHRRRKQMFMSLMTADRLGELIGLFEEHWLRRIAQWAEMDEVVLHCETEQLLCGAVCQWVGVPLTEAANRQRTREFAAMIDGAGAVGPRNWKGLLLRSRTEDWARSIIDGVRAGHVPVPPGCAAEVIALHRDAGGELLDTRVAAVELINVMRPTVAVARYVTFAALAMHRYPGCRQGMASGDPDYAQWFVQEVRRFYPFFTAVGGRALEDFEWRGVRFPRGTWMLLDMYGTNHDPRIWGDPEVFRPERFRDWSGSPFNFIPQGGGDIDFGHRCAGEAITIELVKAAARLLASAMDYDVPAQDLGIDLSRMPAIPASRFIIGNVRRRQEQGAHAAPNGVESRARA
jgi:fatty-acid peroxygenase